jgi:hypothetical protein
MTAKVVKNPNGGYFVIEYGNWFTRWMLGPSIVKTCNHSLKDEENKKAAFLWAKFYNNEEEIEVEHNETRR